MNNFVFVCVRHGRQRLTRKIQCPGSRYTTFDPVRQRFVTQFHSDNKLLVDVARIHDRQNIWMPEFGGDLYFVQELLVPGLIIGLWNFQRDFYLLNRILCPIHIRKRSRRDTSENSVFTESLAGL